jgi:hypothetical protein
LIDTSAWVSFFRGKPGATADLVDAALAEGSAALCGPVVTELRRSGSRVERANLLLHLGGCHLLEQPGRLWEEAGELGFALARRGVAVKTLGLLIATYALAHGVSLLTADSDFALMRRSGIPLDLA